jgi:hypothetical protein
VRRLSEVEQRIERQLGAFAFHDRATLRPALVRKILIKDVGLAEDEARKLL